MSSIATPILALFALVALAIAQIYYYESREIPPTGPQFVSFIDQQADLAQKFNIELKSERAENIELYSPRYQSLAFTGIPLSILKAGEKFAQSCNEEDYKEADAIARKLSLSPNKLLIWYQSVCQKKLEIFAPWLNRKPFLHPSGTSYGWLFLQTHKQKSNFDKQSMQNLLHIRERTQLSDFDQWFLGLTNIQQDQFLSSFQIKKIGLWLVSVKNVKQKLTEVSLYPIHKIKKALKDEKGYNFFVKESAQSCDIYEFDLCFVKQSKNLFWYFYKWKTTLLIYFLFYLLLLALLFWRENESKKKRFLSEQAQLFQVISHEARTPLTSIKLSLDSLRDNFDHLNEVGQRALLSIIESTADLEKVVVRSLNEIYLTEQKDIFDVNQVTRGLILRKYEDLVSFTLAPEPIWINMSLFWYEICLSNLVRNALRHGEGSVSVKVWSENSQVSIEVADEGMIDVNILKSFLKPFKKSGESNGLGLGLSIVAQKIKAQKGGSFEVLAKPTRFVIKLKKVME